MTPTLVSGLIGALVIAIGFTANFYLFSQWLVYPKQRRRLRVYRPHLAFGWALYVLGGSILAPLGRVQDSALLHAGGGLVGFIGLGLTVYASTRLLRANAAERRAAKGATASPQPEGIWPPPPNIPAA